MERPYQVCSKCVMDTSDPDIVFDDQGVCNHCRDNKLLHARHRPDAGQAEKLLARLVADMRAHGKGKEYDCVLGLSGGVDSSYVAYTAKLLGLRPLAVHLDNGWDSELAVANIERIVKTLGIDLHTHVIDWEEFRDLQRAFFAASVVDIELLTDHAILAAIYHTARARGIKYFLSGYNVATESVMPRSWYFGNKFDSLNIRSIYRRHGETRPISTFPILSFVDILLFVFARRVKTIPLLNYLNYDKTEAMDLLQKELGWVYYGGKHYESRFTHFYQAYILPRKFKADKRRAHYSSLISSGQMTRERTLPLLRENLYEPDRLRQDREFVIKKLGFSDAEFEAYLDAPARSHYEFASYDKIYRMLISLFR